MQQSKEEAFKHLAAQQALQEFLDAASKPLYKPRADVNPTPNRKQRRAWLAQQRRKDKKK